MKKINFLLYFIISVLVTFVLNQIGERFTENSTIHDLFIALFFISFLVSGLFFILYLIFKIISFSEKIESRPTIITTVNKYATFWLRFWAGLVDGIIFLPISIPFYYLLRSNTIPTWIQALTFIIISLLGYAYGIYFHGKYGQTIGKMVLKVKVMDVSEERIIGYKQALLRDIIPLCLVILLLPHETIQILNHSYFPIHKHLKPDFIDQVHKWISFGWFLLEVITMLTNSKRRAIHDFIAGSVVVRMEQ